MNTIAENRRSLSKLHVQVAYKDDVCTTDRIKTTSDRKKAPFKLIVKHIHKVVE